MKSKEYYVYVITNQARTVFYTGVTNDLPRRIYEHKTKLNPKSFTARYNCDRLVYYEIFSEIGAAINREKQIKGWKRVKKNDMIQSINPQFRDLYLDF